MKDCSVDVDEDDRDKGDDQELELPVIGVDERKGRRDAEQGDDQNEANE